MSIIARPVLLVDRQRSINIHRSLAAKIISSCSNRESVVYLICQVCAESWNISSAAARREQKVLLERMLMEYIYVQDCRMELLKRISERLYTRNFFSLCTVRTFINLLDREFSRLFIEA
ncbi:hypothetical protein AVEN_263040-1 [Araneus ventricosus]|uniref:Uncharacterized protein n=1 Tax=Araneus ventricosus TaxID=182803 RepID=A0A4Y2GP64_ARAVE|nr:hypothetical protein AVEN_263040-1 [Araneus ventricosus]